MINAPERLLIVLATITLVGIIGTQMFWVTKGISNENQQFHHSVQMALNDVVESLCEIGGNDIPSNNPVERISNNYFIVRTNNRINLESLEYLLQAELEKRAITQNFEYGVYDCETESMVYGDLVNLSQTAKGSPKGHLPTLEEEAYYFGVYFPDRSTALFGGDTRFWSVISIITAIVVFSLGYGLFVILRQKKLGDIQRDFINNITHEFKTPLATLKIAAEVFKDPANAGNQRLEEYGKIVELETIRLESQVHQLLRNSVLDKKPVIQRKKLTLQHLIEDVVERLKPALTESRKEVRLQLKHEGNIRGDEELLKIVFYNLLDNAIKYGGDLISIGINEIGKAVNVYFEDNGTGIPKPERKKIFKKFYRVSSGDRQEVRGFGLGLYFVKNVLDRHHSQIRIEGQKGNIFHLKFQKT